MIADPGEEKVLVKFSLIGPQIRKYKINQYLWAKVT